MGEVKRRKEARKKRNAAIANQFQGDGIDVTKFGFYDDPNFIRQETDNPDYLNLYAEWVNTRPLDNDYIKHVRKIAPEVVTLVADAFIEDEWQGSCVAGAGMVSRIFDRLGVWSYAVHGTAIFETVKPRIWRGLHVADFKDFEDALLGHAWVCAPPFYILDPTAKLQRWGDDPIKFWIPKAIIDDKGRLAKPKVNEIVSANMRQAYSERDGVFDKQLHHRLEPTLKEFGSKFPGTEITLPNLKVRYFPSAVRQTDVPLEEINTDGSVGKTGGEIWEDVIKSAIDATALI